MHEAFPDPMAKWSPAPDWSTARLTRPDWRAAPVDGLHQTLLTGDLAAALATFDPRPASVGLWDVARAPAAVRIARDRALVVSSQAPATAWGWRDEGWAASDASDAYIVLSLAGPALREIVAEATSADLDRGSRSAAIQFAGVAALLYRAAEDEARLHVEASWAAYVWRWLETR
jgi:heterotetrameric sarcosine oxidase gamma subunit